MKAATACGRAVFAVAVALAGAGTVMSPASAATTLEVRVNAASDDATASGADAMSIKMNYWPVGAGLSSGARFANVIIPHAAAITSAYLVIDAYTGASATTVNSMIRGQASDNAPTFTTNRVDFDSRPRTAAGVAWTNIPPWTASVIYHSPDISSVIQEIVDRPGWQAGNSLVIFWEDDGSTGTAARQGRSFNWNPDRATGLHVEYEHTQPSVLGSLGKTRDGWSGAIPVYMSLEGGLTNSAFPFARARVVTPAAETYYTPMAWQDSAARFEGTIYIGSWYGNGCADPNIGAYTVTVQLDNNPDFSSVDYENTVGVPFTTFVTRRWNAISVSAHGYDTEFLPTWNGNHWDYRIHDFSLSHDVPSYAQTNVAFAIPFHPVTATISNLAVTIDGVPIPEGSAASTEDCWWWVGAAHTLYVQLASVAAWTNRAVALAFDSDTDLFATRIDFVANYSLGAKAFYNGFVFANRYIDTPMIGGGHELAGSQVATHARNLAIDDDINIDCQERVAVHVDDTVIADASGQYNASIKWRQDEWRDYIVSEDTTSIVVRVTSDDTPVTGWAQQLTNGIAAQRIQTYYAGKRYIKNTYTLRNTDKVAHKYPFVWGREQYIGPDLLQNDKGRCAGDEADRTTEAKVALSSLPAPWFTAYDCNLFAALGVICQRSDTADYGYFLVHTPITQTAEWPIVATGQGANPTQNTSTFLEKVYGAVAPGESVSFTFWMWGGDFLSWEELGAAIEADSQELNPAAIRKSGSLLIIR